MTERVQMQIWSIQHDHIELVGDSFTWRVHSEEALGIAVKSLAKFCDGNALFRGQIDANWPLHSKYRRAMEELHPSPKSQCAVETQGEWNAWHFQLVKHYIERYGRAESEFVEFSELCRAKGFDLHFELHKAVQQYADFLPERGPLIGSNLVDFSRSYFVGLFFSAYDPGELKTDKPGAIYVVDPTPLGHIEQGLSKEDGQSQIVIEFKEDLNDQIPKSDFPLYQIKSSIPCARSTAQEAVYLAQMDFRHCATVPWSVVAEKMRRQHYCKIEYPAEFKPAVLAYCAEHGVHESAMYPDDPFWIEKVTQFGVQT